MNANPTPNQLLIALLLLVLFGIIYAAIIRRMRRRNPDHGQTAWLVVVGNATITAAFTALYGINAGAVLLACMAAAGLPMIIEYVDDHLDSAERRRIAEILRIVGTEPTEDRHAVPTNDRRL
jgi:hypothetical protein